MREAAGGLVMGWIIWGTLLPACLVAAGLVLMWPARLVCEEVRDERARARFRLGREWLEARFLSALARADAVEGRRWESAHWFDEVVWARDRRTRRLVAMVGVWFDPPPFDGDPFRRHATALFEFRRGRWQAEGKRLDETRPDEAFVRHQRFERVVVPSRRG